MPENRFNVPTPTCCPIHQSQTIYFHSAVEIEHVPPTVIGNSLALLKTQNGALGLHEGCVDISLNGFYSGYMSESDDVSLLPLQCGQATSPVPANGERDFT